MVLVKGERLWCEKFNCKYRVDYEQCNFIDSEGNKFKCDECNLKKCYYCVCTDDCWKRDIDRTLRNIITRMNDRNDRVERKQFDDSLARMKNKVND